MELNKEQQQRKECDTKSEPKCDLDCVSAIFNWQSAKHNAFLIELNEKLQETHTHYRHESARKQRTANVYYSLLWLKICIFILLRYKFVFDANPDAAWDSNGLYVAFKDIFYLISAWNWWQCFIICLDGANTKNAKLLLLCSCTHKFRPTKLCKNQTESRCWRNESCQTISNLVITPPTPPCICSYRLLWITCDSQRTNGYNMVKLLMCERTKQQTTTIHLKEEDKCRALLLKIIDSVLPNRCEKKM